MLCLYSRQHWVVFGVQLPVGLRQWSKCLSVIGRWANLMVVCPGHTIVCFTHVCLTKCSLVKQLRGLMCYPVNVISFLCSFVGITYASSPILKCRGYSNQYFQNNSWLFIPSILFMSYSCDFNSIFDIIEISNSSFVKFLLIISLFFIIISALQWCWSFLL